MCNADSPRHHRLVPYASWMFVVTAGSVDRVYTAYWNMDGKSHPSLYIVIAGRSVVKGHNFSSFTRLELCIWK